MTLVQLKRAVSIPKFDRKKKCVPVLIGPVVLKSAQALESNAME